MGRVSWCEANVRYKMDIGGIGTSTSRRWSTFYLKAVTSVGMTQRKVSRRCQELLLNSLLTRLSKPPNIIVLAYLYSL